LKSTTKTIDINENEMAMTQEDGIRKLKLWHVTWPDDESGNYPSWDYYDSLVVAAKNEESARNFVPYNPVNNSSRHWATDPSCLTVEYLGEAAENVKYGMVIGSFNQS
jgi:hypothetical protein